MNNATTYAGLSDRGRVREDNEDAWTAVPEHGLFVVSDGMAGQLGGKVASRIVVRALPPLLRKRMAGVEDLTSPEAKERLLSALSELSDHVRAETKDQLGLGGMGATVVLAMVRDLQALIGHMGDSRAYVLRGGRLAQLTRDHSIVQLLLDEGEITPGEAADHPARGQLTRYVGMEGESLPEAQVVELRPGDRLLLCTDGLTGMLSDEEIQRICEDNPEPEAACKALLAAGNEAGGEDNMTALLVSVPSDSD